MVVFTKLDSQEWCLKMQASCHHGRSCSTIQTQDGDLRKNRQDAFTDCSTVNSSKTIDISCIIQSISTITIPKDLFLKCNKDPPPTSTSDLCLLSCCCLCFRSPFVQRNNKLTLNLTVTVMTWEILYAFRKLRQSNGSLHHFPDEPDAGLPVLRPYLSSRTESWYWYIDSKEHRIEPHIVWLPKSWDCATNQ